MTWWLFLILAGALIIALDFFSRRLKQPAIGSRGEQEIRRVLTQMGLKFKEQVPVTINGKVYRFDFKVDSGPWIEYDGNQHFEQIDLFHKTPEAFKRQQESDRIKTQWVLNQGENLIRIDSSSPIELHLKQSLNSTSGLYVSNPTRYQYLN